MVKSLGAALRHTQRMQQRLIDPELCKACFTCHEACPRGAVVIEARRVAIDPAACGRCGACVVECGTAAIDHVREVPDGAPWSIAEQLAWDRLPPDYIA